MTIDFLIILTVVACFAVIQSIFGMGILVFGTPTLILLGYDFQTTLSHLLPASFAISLMQVQFSGRGRARVSPHLYTLCLPGIGVGLLLTDLTFLTPWVNSMVGGTLLLSALVRVWPRAQAFLTDLLRNHMPLYHAVMGVIHGLTNLGGALLAVLASATSEGKVNVRHTVAHYYLAFSIIQMIILVVFLDKLDLLIVGAKIAVVSALVYVLIGNWVFKKTSEKVFNTAFTVFIAFYGLAVLMKS